MSVHQLAPPHVIEATHLKAKDPDATYGDADLLVSSLQEYGITVVRHPDLANLAAAWHQRSTGIELPPHEEVGDDVPALLIKSYTSTLATNGIVIWNITGERSQTRVCHYT